MADLLSQSFRLPDGRTLAYAEYGVPAVNPYSTSTASQARAWNL